MGHLNISYFTTSAWIYPCPHLILWYPWVSLYRCPALCVFVSVCLFIVAILFTWMSDLHRVVSLNKILCAVAVSSFQPLTPSFRLAWISCFLTTELRQSPQLCVTNRILTNLEDSEVQQWVHSINRLSLPMWRCIKYTHGWVLWK